jgi:predicted acylesterase/phospholipase RssA
MSGPPPHDLVLSSGFLAFARQAGVLAAIEAVGPPIDGVCGTSSGALAGALWASGLPAAEVAVELSRRQPWQLMRVHGAFWRGLFSMGEVIDLLTELLPPTFADLDRPFAVGVRLPDGTHGLVHDGPLAPAVAASCAMPGVFAPVELAPGPCQDGGAVDRVGLDAWRRWRGARPTVVHQVDRTAGADVSLDLAQVTLIRTPRSGARFWDLGDFEGQRAEAEALASAALTGVAPAAP